MRSRLLSQAVLVGSSGAFLVTGYLVHFIVAHAFGPSIYGRIGLAVTLLTAANFLLTSGITFAVSRELRRPDVSTSVTIRTTAAVAAAFALIGLGVLTVAAFLPLPTLRPDRALILAAATALPAYAGSAFVLGIVNSRHQFGRQGLSLTVGYLVRLGAVVVASWILESSVLVVLAYGVGAATTAMIGIGSINLDRSQPPGAIDFRVARRFVGGIFSGTSFNSAVFFLMNSDILVLGILAISRTDYGGYLAVASLAKVPFYFSTGFANIVLPHESSKQGAARPWNASTVVGRAVWLSLLFSAVWGVALISGGRPLLAFLFGAEFVPAAALILPMAPGAAALTVISIFGALLFARGRIRAATYAVASCSAILACAAFVLAGRVPLSWIAWSSSLTLVAAAVVVVYVARIVLHDTAKGPVLSRAGVEVEFK